MASTEKYEFTAKKIAVLRDAQSLSWRKVAEELDLGSPGAARRAYSVLVRPHAESVLPGRAAGATVQPVTFGADTDLVTLREALAGRTIRHRLADHRNALTRPYVRPRPGSNGRPTA